MRKGYFGAGALLQFKNEYKENLFHHIPPIHWKTLTLRQDFVDVGPVVRYYNNRNAFAVSPSLQHIL